jgi:hypothetical protein
VPGKELEQGGLFIGSNPLSPTTFKETALVAVFFRLRFGDFI